MRYGMLQSLKTADAAYACTEWYQGSSSFKSCIAIMIARSQSPVKLTCGKLCVLSLESYANVSIHQWHNLRREFVILKLGFTD
jgi:hypothetical protein